MIKEEQRITQILNKYRRQEDKGREKDNLFTLQEHLSSFPVQRELFTLQEHLSSFPVQRELFTLVNSSLWTGSELRRS
jgi:hypothetical protein